ncbi:MAG: TolC family protein [Parvibaculaceae bacterium]
MFRFITTGWLYAVLATGPAVAAAPLEADGTTPVALSAIVANILSENPSIASAQARLRAAQARAEGAGLWRYNPEIEYERENTDVRTETVGVSQTLEWFSKPGARGRAADSRTESAALELASIRQRVIAEVLSGFALVDQRREMVQLASKRTQSMTRFVELSERLLREGDISPSEAQAARVAATQAVMEEQIAVTELSSAEQDLAELVGTAPLAWPSFEKVLPEPLNVDEVDVDRLPSVLAARYSRDAAERDVTVAQWDRVPDPSIGLRWGDEGGADLFGFRVSIPIPVLNSGRAEVAASRADAVSAAAELQGAQRAATALLRETARRYEALRSSQILWQTGGENALAQQTDLLERRLSGGDIGAIEYLIQLQQLYDAQNSSIELQGQAWTAWFQLLEAAGVVEKWIGTEQ